MSSEHKTVRYGELKQEEEATRCLGTNSETDTLSEDFKAWPSQQGRAERRKWFIHWFIHAISLVIIATLLVRLDQNAKSIAKQSLYDDNLYSPLLDVIDRKISTKKFMGTFRGWSPYKGPPTKEVQKAWSDIVDFEFINITAEAMTKMGRSLDSAQFPSELGGGYLGLFETGHHLHCLRSVWEDHHIEKSHHAKKFKEEMPEVYESHFEHCVDELRQRIMCTADPNVITYRWVKGIEEPYPDFNTEHRCANVDDMLDWIRENQVRFPKGYKFTAPADAVRLPSPP